MNRSEELCKLLTIEPKCLDSEYSGCCYADDDSRKCCKRYNENSCKYSQYWIFPDLTNKNNLQKLKSIFKEWSNPFNFIEDGEYKDFYWAHRSGDNYICFLNMALPRIMSSCLNKAIKQAQQIEWEY